jgi:hypothetical protein
MRTKNSTGGSSMAQVQAAQVIETEAEAQALSPA